MSVKQKAGILLFITAMAAVMAATIFAENGLLDLRRLKQERQALRIENCRIGLTLIKEIDFFKRLADDKSLEQSTSPMHFIS